MAKIVKFTKDSASVGNKMTEVECTYKVGYVNNEKIVAFSTYGSDTRKKEGASQILHFDKESAKQLIDILMKEFEL